MADTSAVGKHYLLAPNSALFGIFQLQSLQMLQMVSAEKFTFHSEHICKASLGDFVVDLGVPKEGGKHWPAKDNWSCFWLRERCQKKGKQT